MPVTEQDARAIAYLAGRLREDTHGANRWDSPGIWAEVSPLIGQNLAVTIERVTRHAQDPDAKTPGAIRRPYVPGPPENRRELEHLAPEDRCGICAKSHYDCDRNPWADHKFEPDFRPTRDVDISPVVAELKGHLEPMKTPSAPREALSQEEGA